MSSGNPTPGASFALRLVALPAGDRIEKPDCTGMPREATPRSPIRERSKVWTTRQGDVSARLRVGRCGGAGAAEARRTRRLEGRLSRWRLLLTGRERPYVRRDVGGLAGGALLPGSRVGWRGSRSAWGDRGSPAAVSGEGMTPGSGGAGWPRGGDPRGEARLTWSCRQRRDGRGGWAIAGEVRALTVRRGVVPRSRDAEGLPNVGAWRHRLPRCHLRLGKTARSACVACACAGRSAWSPAGPSRARRGLRTVGL